MYNGGDPTPPDYLDLCEVCEKSTDWHTKEKELECECKKLESKPPQKGVWFLTLDYGDTWEWRDLDGLTGEWFQLVKSVYFNGEKLEDLG